MRLDSDTGAARREHMTSDPRPDVTMSMPAAAIPPAPTLTPQRLRSFRSAITRSIIIDSYLATNPLIISTNKYMIITQLVT